ncbi:MAG: hypothetical protein J7M25_15035, partial [Deltaproteobacteria bacterium]|nr:hypothetical protein [Deltaproteobacteria bacterium]
INGQPIQTDLNHPSRTAVDFNFDVWVANRAFGGQASATKIANSIDDCIDRNGIPGIDTSQDQDGDGQITLDCDGDGHPDDLSTVCTNGLPPEFLGLDDECVLFTVNYGSNDAVGRSICLDAGDPYSGGNGNAWVGTFSLSPNVFYKLDGTTGAILDQVTLSAGMNVYGCTVDRQGILWATDIDRAHITYFDTGNTTQKGPLLSPPWSSSGAFYGICTDGEANIWLGGWSTYNAFRYRPNRTSFDSLDDGVWTRIRTSEEGMISHTRGIAADLRGWVWVASNNGYIVRLPGGIQDGDWTWAQVAAQGAMRINLNLGGGMIGVGLDFDGNVWGMSYDASTATKIDLDPAGNPVDLTNNVYVVPVGLNPYTYSDFTGYGLRNFTRPRGTYRYIMEGCGDSQETHWIKVEWNATTPPGTSVRVRVRVGDDTQTFGAWFGPWDQSPAVLTDPPEGPVLPDPAPYIQVEFELMSDDQETTPVVHDYKVVWDCGSDIPG